MAEEKKAEKKEGADKEADTSDVKSTEEKQEKAVDVDDGDATKKDGQDGRPSSPDAAKGGSFEDLDDDDNTALYKQHNWPLEGIKEPHENDVLYGRGGGTNHHPGNKRYRKQVEEKKVEYVNSKRLEKPLVALNIIRKWRRDQVPPGRFLKINDKTGLWDDVGDKKAREKTSQALREKAPVLRKQQEELDSELMQPHVCIIDHGGEEGYYDETDVFDDGDLGGSGYTPLQIERKEVVHVPPTATQSNGTRGEFPPREKNTRFATGTKSPAPSKLIARPAFGHRLHSLGTEVPDEDALRGFSWDKPLSGESMSSRTDPVQQRQREAHGEYGDLPTSKIKTSASEDYDAYFPRRGRTTPTGVFVEDKANIDFGQERPHPSVYSSGGYKMRNTALRHVASHDDADIPYRMSRDVSEEEYHFRELSMRRQPHVGNSNVGRANFEANIMESAPPGGQPRHESSPFQEERMSPNPYQNPNSMSRGAMGENLIEIPPPPSPYAQESREHSFAELPFEKYRRRPSFPPDQTSVPHTSFYRSSTNPYHRSPVYSESFESPYEHDRPVHDGSISVMEREMERGRSFEQNAADSPFDVHPAGNVEFANANVRGRFEFSAGPSSHYSNMYQYRSKNGRFSSASPIDSIGSNDEFSEQDFPYMNPEQQLPSNRKQLRVMKAANPRFSGASKSIPGERRITNESTPSKNVIRPLMKRDTSHQAEKPDVKKDTKMRRGVQRDFDMRQHSPIDEPAHHFFDTMPPNGDEVDIPAQHHHSDVDLLDHHVAEEAVHGLAPSMAEISLNNACSPEHWQEAEDTRHENFGTSSTEGRNFHRPAGFSMADRATTLEKLGSLLDDKEPADDFENAAWLDEVSPEAV